MHQYRHLIDPLHTVFVWDDERMLESMVEALRCRDVARDVPIACGQSSFLRGFCEMLIVNFEGMYTDEHVPLVLRTPAISDSDRITQIGSRAGALTTQRTNLEVAGHLKT